MAKVKYLRKKSGIFARVDGTDLGPFDSKDEARDAAKEHVKAAKSATDDGAQGDTPPWLAKALEDDEMASIVERFIGGESFGSLAKSMELSRSVFRRKLYDVLGGKENYEKLRDRGAGGVGNTNAAGSTSVSDKGVPVIDGTPYAEGWRSRVEYINVGGAPIKGADVYLPLVSTSVFTSPDGEEYVLARANERADLIVDLKGDEKYKGFGKARLRRIETSSLGRKIEHREKQIERGEAALERKREEKRKKRRQRVRRK